MSEFNIAISSTDSLLMHPSNRAECFTTNFSIPLTLEGNWEVAIKNITYPTNVLIIGHDCEFALIIDKIENGTHNIQQTSAVLVPPGHYKGVTDLTDYCVNAFYEIYPKYRKDGLFEMVDYNRDRKVYISSVSKYTCFVFTKGEDLKAALGFQDYQVGQCIELPVYGNSTLPYYSAISYFLITCDIVQPSLYGDEYMSILQMERYMLDGKPRTVEYENPLYYKLQKSFINSITIKLLHPTKYLATFEYGQTSMILSFRKSVEENIHVIIPSNTSPDNTSTQFQVALPKQLNLKGYWRVALHAITYSNTYQPLTKSRAIAKLSTTTPEKREKYFTIEIDENRLGPDGLAIEISNAFISKHLKVDDEPNSRLKTNEEIEPWLLDKLPIVVSKDPFTNHLTMFGPADINTKILFTSKDVLQFLGFDHPHNKFITLPITSKNKPSFFHDKQGFFITSNILKPNHLGNGFAKILQYVPLQPKNYKKSDTQTMEVVKKEYINPTFHELESNKLKQLQFKLVDLKDQLITFNEGLTCLQLEFKHVTE